jgi:uncharacterized Zn-binding protein involved in type VI secretion
MPPAARVGDATTHGGTLLPPGIPKVLIGGQPAACAPNPHACPITAPPPHAVTPTSPGSVRVLINGMPALRVGDAAGCGAVIVGGFPRALFG